MKLESLSAQTNTGELPLKVKADPNIERKSEVIKFVAKTVLHRGVRFIDKIQRVTTGKILRRKFTELIKRLLFN